MAKGSNASPPSPIDPAVRVREFRDLADLVRKHPLNQSHLDDWVHASANRRYVLQDMFFGSIRWAGVDRPLQRGYLGDGFSLKLRNYFNVYYVGAGGEVIDKDGYMDMPDPDAWDATDDADYHKVVYGGWYARYNLYVDRNKLRIMINGAWTTPSPRLTHRFLLPKPPGFIFGSFDGRRSRLTRSQSSNTCFGPNRYGRSECKSAQLA